MSFKVYSNTKFIVFFTDWKLIKLQVSNRQFSISEIFILIKKMGMRKFTEQYFRMDIATTAIHAQLI